MFIQAAELSLATQLTGHIMPIQQTKPVSKARAITEDEKKISVFRAMRVARANARLVGIRQKRLKEKAEAELKLKK